MTEGRILIGILDPEPADQLNLATELLELATLDDGQILAICVSDDETALRSATRALAVAGADPLILASQTPHLRDLWLEETK